MSKVKKEAPATPKKEVAVKSEDAAMSQMTPGGTKKAAKPEEPAVPVHEWWNDTTFKSTKRGEQRWTTLEHKGPLFPPPYVVHGIPIKYNGQVFRLTPEEEEVATMFASMKLHDNYKNEVFRKNFFGDWTAILQKRPEGRVIRTLELCDFEDIFKHWQAERERLKNRDKETKKRDKEANDALCAPFRTCVWDGRIEELANFRVEPPGLFRGRGKHPKIGKLKTRIQPEDVTLNLGDNAPVPACPAGHKWGGIVHEKFATWLAMWKDPVNDNFKYVMLGAASTVKGATDRDKYEKARKLKECIARIRASYTRDLASKDPAEQQRAVCMYFIDRLALRVGNEKGSDEADTVGCCSLRVEHVAALDGNILRFDFLGKDSIRYVNSVAVEPAVHALVTKLRAGRGMKQDLFEAVTPSSLNDHLKELMPELSAKVFRTYNASQCLQDELAANPVPEGATVEEKLVYFNAANTKVAVLCNHQKTVSKNHATQMTQLNYKIENAQNYVRWLTRAQATEAKRGREAAMAEFYKDEDAKHEAWLQRFGTPELRAARAALIASRGTRGGGAKGAAAAESDSDADADAEDATIAAALAAEEQIKRKREAAAAAAEESDSDDDDGDSADGSDAGSASEDDGKTKKKSKKGDKKGKKAAASRKDTKKRASSPAKKAAPSAAAGKKGAAAAKAESPAAGKKRGRAAAKEASEEESSAEEESDDEAPQPKKKGAATRGGKRARTEKADADEDSGSEEDAPKANGKKQQKGGSPAAAAKKGAAAAKGGKGGKKK